MKKALVYLALLCSLYAQGQTPAPIWNEADGLCCHPKKKDTRYNWKKGALTAGFGAVAGTAWGLHELSVHKPSQLPPSWNRQYWDASQSWTNKYWHGDPQQGPKFPYSTTALVFLTDGKHMTATVHRAALLGAGITIGIGERKPWWHYAADAVLGFAAYTTTFHAVYTYQMFTAQ